MPIAPFSAEVARANKLTIYILPQDLDISAVDPLLREIVTIINSSGWVWTSESCQGHPDATVAGETGWDHNTNPFLRLIVEEKDVGTVLALLTAAMRGTERTCTMRLHTIRKGDWLELIVYVEAFTTLTRNRGIEALSRFAASLERREIPEIAAAASIFSPRPLVVQRLRSMAEKLESDERFSNVVGLTVMAGIKELLRQAADQLENSHA